jgi:hypothetical protein
VRRDVADHERVAVGRRARGLLAGDRAAAATDVLDHELLVERLAELGADGAADQVEAPAGLGGDDDLDGFCRVGLGKRRPRPYRR